MSSALADELIQVVHPRRVLCAACEDASLVEAFLDRGIYCEGFFNSHGDLNRAPSGIRPFCFVASLAAPIAVSFDLIVLLNVAALEDLSSVLQNAASACDALLFSPFPQRPILHWLQLLGESGFIPDASFDGTRLNYVLLRRKPVDQAEFHRLFLDSRDIQLKLRSKVEELQDVHASQESSAVQVRSLEKQRDSLGNELDLLKARLRAIPLQSDPALTAVNEGGERVTPDVVDDVFVAHLSIYDFAARQVKGKRVLDAGCGSGYGSYHLIEQGKAKSVFAVDISQKAIDFCRKRFRHPSLRFDRLSLESLGGLERQFDYVYCSNVLEHVSDLDASLSRLAKILKPEGSLLLAVPPVVSKAHLLDSFRNPYHLNNFHPVQWHAKALRFFQQATPYTHEPRPGVRLDFSGTHYSAVSSYDFRIEPVPSANLLESLISTLTLILVAEGPRVDPLPPTDTEQIFPKNWNVEQLWQFAEPERRAVFASVGKEALYCDSDLRKRIYPISARSMPLV